MIVLNLDKMPDCYKVEKKAVIRGGGGGGGGVCCGDSIKIDILP